MDTALPAPQTPDAVRIDATAGDPGRGHEARVRPAAPAAERWAGVSGFAALLLAGAGEIFERGAVTPADSAATVIAHFTDHQAAIQAQGMLLLAGGAAFLPFLAGVRARLARADGGAGTAPAVAFGAAAVWVAINMVALTFQLGMAAAPAAAPPPALISVMNVTFTVAALPLVLVLGAVGVATLRGGGFPRWSGLLALLTAAGQLVLWMGTVIATGPLAADGWLTYVLYPLFLIWLIPIAAMMVRPSRTMP